MKRLTRLSMLFRMLVRYRYHVACVLLLAASVFPLSVDCAESLLEAIQGLLQGGSLKYLAHVALCVLGIFMCIKASEYCIHGVRCSAAAYSYGILHRNLGPIDTGHDIVHSYTRNAVRLTYRSMYSMHLFIFGSILTAVALPAILSAGGANKWVLGNVATASVITCCFAFAREIFSSYYTARQDYTDNSVRKAADKILATEATDNAADTEKIMNSTFFGLNTLYLLCCLWDALCAITYVIPVFYFSFHMLRDGIEVSNVIAIQLLTVVVAFSTAKASAALRDLVGLASIAIDSEKLLYSVISMCSVVGGKARNKSGALQLTDLVYTNEEGCTLLENINISIGAGRKVAFVVTDNNVKAALIALLTGKAAPTKGSIAIDGVSKMSTPYSSDVVSLVSSAIDIYRDTIRHNILRDRDHDISDSNLFDVISLASLREFVYSFPSRELSSLDPDGDISPCERKRIALARAIVADPKVLLVDEPIIGLEDDDNEKAVQSTMTYVSSKRTTIIFTSNPALVTDVDCIYIFDGGKVVESGSHKSLLGSGGVYAHLYLRYYNGVQVLH